MRTIDDDERRARLALRHHLARRTRSIERAAGAIVGLHSSDPATVYLSARARVVGATPASVERALYERRSLVRMLGMRRTLFVVPTDLAGVVDTACTRDLVPRERRRMLRLLEEQGVTDDPGTWLDDVAARTLASIAAHGEAAARTVTADVPELATKLTFGEGTRWAGTVGVSTRVLFLLATEGRIVRVRPAGSWTSGQYRWATTESWLDGGFPSVDPAAAHEALLARWLRGFGPATTIDVRWWTGWTAARTRSALDAVGAVEVGLEGGTGWVLPDDLRTVARPRRWVALLPALDPTTMGWKERAWYLGDHAATTFDRNGNAGPTVWADGRVVGAWGQDPDGAVLVRMLEDVDDASAAAIERERTRLQAWLAGTRVTPRFRTPIERELSA